VDNLFDLGFHGFIILYEDYAPRKRFMSRPQIQPTTKGKTYEALEASYCSRGDNRVHHGHHGDRW